MAGSCSTSTRRPGSGRRPAARWGRGSRAGAGGRGLEGLSGRRGAPATGSRRRAPRAPCRGRTSGRGRGSLRERRPARRRGSDRRRLAVRRRRAASRSRRFGTLAATAGCRRGAGGGDSVPACGASAGGVWEASSGLERAPCEASADAGGAGAEGGARGGANARAARGARRCSRRGASSTEARRPRGAAAVTGAEYTLAGGGSLAAGVCTAEA